MSPGPKRRNSKVDRRTRAVAKSSSASGRLPSDRTARHASRDTRSGRTERASTSGTSSQLRMTSRPYMRWRRVLPSALSSSDQGFTGPSRKTVTENFTQPARRCWVSEPGASSQRRNPGAAGRPTPAATTLAVRWRHEAFCTGVSFPGRLTSHHSAERAPSPQTVWLPAKWIAHERKTLLYSIHRESLRRLRIALFPPSDSGGPPCRRCCT